MFICLVSDSCHVFTSYVEGSVSFTCTEEVCCIVAGKESSFYGESGDFDYCVFDIVLNVRLNIKF